MIRKLIVCALIILCSGFYLNAENKPIISVLDFTTDGLSKSEMKTIISFLSSALFKTGKFTVIDVQEREKLLSEIEFSVSGCSDESCYLEIGKLLSAQFIVIGNIGKVGSRFLLAAKILKTESGQTINSAEGIYLSLDAIVDDLYNIAETLSKIDEKKDSTKIADDKKTSDKKDTTTDKESETKKDDKKTTDLKDTNTDKEKETGKEKDDKEKTVPSSKRFFSIGAEAGWTVPFGELNIALENTLTSIACFRYNMPLKGNIDLGIGIKTGYQSEKTSGAFPIPYNMGTIPLAADFIFRFIPFPVFFLSAGFSAGFCLNMVDYLTEGYNDLVTAKFFSGIGIGTGFILMNRFSLYVKDDIFMIFFNSAIYIANSLGMGIELKI